VGEWLKENREISTAVWCGASPTSTTADYLQSAAEAFELDCFYLSGKRRICIEKTSLMKFCYQRRKPDERYHHI